MTNLATSLYIWWVSSRFDKSKMDLQQQSSPYESNKTVKCLNQ